MQALFLLGAESSLALPLEDLTSGAVAVAGGKIIGAALRWPGGEALKLESGWRGRGIEPALQDLLEAGSEAAGTQQRPASEQP